jgi:hypothetical protein
MIRTALTVAAVLAFAPLPAFAEDWDFVLTNATGKTIKSFELAASGSGSWAANKFDAELKKETTLKANAKTTIHFDKGSGCKYDLKATFADGSSAVWSGINVCDNSYVVIRHDGGTPSFKAN